MPQLFRPAADTIARIILVGLLVLPFSAMAAMYAVMRSPYVTGQSEVLNQPVPFSHRHHVGGLGLDCRHCHAGVESSPYAGMPPTKTCMTCHSELYASAPALAPVRDSLAQKRPIHWNRV